MDSSTIPNIALGLACSGLFTSVVIGAIVEFVGYQAWVATLSQLAARRRALVPRSFAVLSVFFAALAPVYNAHWLPMIGHDSAAVALTLLSALLGLLVLGHAAHREACIAGASVDPRSKRLTKVPYGGERRRELERTARELGLGGGARTNLARVLVTTAAGLTAAVLARVALLASLGHRI